MAEKTIRKRSEIEAKYKWNIESMYNTDFVWKRDCGEVKDAAAELAGYKGRLTESSGTLLEFLNKRS